MNREIFLTQLPDLIKDYKPSRASLARIASVKLLMVIGPSGVGKSAIIDGLNMPFIPSVVTRSARPEEKDGVDMYFISDYDRLTSDIKSGAFLQVLVGASGDFYGSKANFYPAQGWAVMPVLADVVSLFRSLGFKQTLSVFIVPPSYDEWMNRISHHRLDKTTLKKRFSEAKRSLQFANTDPKVHFILNDNLEAAVAQVKDLLIDKIDEKREAKARVIAREIYEEL